MHNGRETVLFDLDGTLLPIDFDLFLKKYFKALTQNFTDVAEPERFIKVLMKATNDMIKNDGSRINKEVFMDSFFAMIDVSDPGALMKRFDRFYREEFPSLNEGLEIDSTPARLIDYLKKRDYQLVLATNPVFPREAVVERLRWGNIDPRDFKLITHYENMHYCKPNPGYFREIIEKLGVQADDCVMIGNDLQEDMIAGELGMATYLVDDYLIDRGSGELKPDWTGSLKELEYYIKEAI